ncbi:MAG TPA: aminopeptidase, partial [Bacteroidia bacterium]|nr:aminopeptidase [Bacteroidia bacterium]
MRKFLKILLWIFLSVLLVALVFALFNRELVSYGWEQFKGQMHIVVNSRPTDEMLQDPAVPDSLKEKIRFIDRVKRFAIDSLGLKPSKNYTTLYDQHGKPILWVVTASEPFAIRAYTWKFPVLGSVSYKGFFNKQKGEKLDSLLQSRGYDTDFGEVSAWSTLGWFRDPILSNMLRRKAGHLAELIIHEMTHATLYAKSNVDF